MNTFSIVSLGCKVNDYEATYIKQELNKSFKYTTSDTTADIYVVMSCCVTNTAEAKTRKVINKLKKQNPNAYICVVGCYPQTKPNAPIFDNVDLVIGNIHKNKVPDYIKESYKGKLIEENKDLSFESMPIKTYPNKSRAFLKIQDGCNQYCSYCAIPYARGNERSESHEKILKIANDLANNYCEIVLTGIHTGKYNDNDYKLYDLLKDLIEIENIKTIRLSSIEINELTDDIIDLISKNNKIAPHLHIPVQSLNDSILKKMNRPYTLKEYKNRIKFIRKKIKNVSISTDLIVGFPGETKTIFKSFFNELDDIKFSFIHTFPYSKKDGTVASTFTNQIDQHEKKDRVNKIIEYQKNITKSYNEKFIGKTLEVLVEENKDDYSFGYTKNYIYVKFKGYKRIGYISKVLIKEIKDNIIIGEYVS